jgi:hypothetical protein
MMGRSRVAKAHYVHNDSSVLDLSHAFRNQFKKQARRLTGAPDVLLQA